MIGSTSYAAHLNLAADIRMCHAVTAISSDPFDKGPSTFTCAGEPRGYQDHSLWLHADLQPQQIDARGMTLLVHQSRFDALTVRFAYADGVERVQQVRRGAYHDHWRTGGQINFSAPQRDARLTSVTLRFDRLSSMGFLRARLLASDRAASDVTMLAMIVGATLTLLGLSTIYNLFLAVAVRRQFIAWHAAWAACVFAWELLWSQLTLLVFPGVAGTLASQICTFIFALAIASATICASLCLGKDYVPRWVRMGLVAFGAVILLLGIPGAIVTGPSIDPIADFFRYVIVANLIAVLGSVIWAWRRGSADARDFALAWTLPMFVLGLSQTVNMGNGVFGGGPQVLVLIASALQTVWLSIAISLRLAKMRSERDAARTEQEMLSELARRDPLTSLLNRRGFTAIVSRWLDECLGRNACLGLLIIDVDHFKQINDRLGHDAGDRVLQDMARRLSQWENDQCCTGRLGGEEFTVAVRDMDEAAFRAFADKVRQGLSSIGHRRGDPLGGIITVSIGAAELREHATFNDLYRAADEALYAAKGAGRNRVAIAEPKGCFILGEDGNLPESPAEPPQTATERRTIQHAASHKQPGEY